jgi:hypothetical protein
MKMCVLLCCFLWIQLAIASDDGRIDDGGGEPVLIGGIDYKGHNVGLINKHGWDFDSQRRFNGYLKNYYTEVANSLIERTDGSTAWVPDGTTDVRGYKSDNVEVPEPGDHIIDTFGHIRPAIVRYWSGP